LISVFLQSLQQARAAASEATDCQPSRVALARFSDTDTD